MRKPGRAGEGVFWPFSVFFPLTPRRLLPLYPRPNASTAPTVQCRRSLVTVWRRCRFGAHDRNNTAHRCPSRRRRFRSAPRAGGRSRLSLSPAGK